MSSQILFFLCLYFIAGRTNALSCKDENNRDVDWFVAYKIPIQSGRGDIIKAGLGHIYLTSTNSSTWTFSKRSIGDNSSLIGNTLHDFYYNRTNLSYILYNNEPPNHPHSAAKGHTKGLVISNAAGGYWLIHSVPKFPEVGNSYSFPSTGVKYGQTFLCVTMNLTNINAVGLQLQYNQPHIYLQQVLSDIKTRVPDLASAAQNVTVKSAPFYRVAQIYSKKKVAFTSFAKHRKFNQELYEDLVAPYLKQDLVVETWPNGAGRLHSNCSRVYKVNNIQKINMSVVNVSFNTTSDHSKWAVTSNSSSSWSCVGDINRAQHQLERGGGTVCLQNQKLSTNFHKLISAVEECPRKESFDIPTVINV
ncbi:plancitoxin-1 isoform X3 [Diabrotica virgifera virgifera]|uniref:Plancitoxin-1 isoform X1 n=1 Tax=Diabrotica virgifera virgifera TaxID=50390 RepID=A0A6P7G675_DIAVI|nr:plancitoxin-1 isoform X3 [Diabrotica virgifera virgifera]